MSLMVSVSGVRGVIGESLTPDVIVQYCSAFAEFISGKKIVLGTDSRVSKHLVKSLASSTFLAHGYEVIDLGIVPTPTVQLMTEKLSADAGIVITASHNPIEWNGLKFIEASGLFLSPNNCKKMFSIAEHKSYSYASWQKLGHVTTNDSSIDTHIQSILDLDIIDADLIKKQSFAVALDTINGAGGTIMSSLLEQLNCQITHINPEENGEFSRSPEPIAENLSELSLSVKNSKSQIGIAVDPDVDRCVLIDENGEIIGEEYTLAIAVKLVLSKKLGHVVKNMSSSRMIDDIAKYYNCLAYEAAVGEINVAKRIQELNAVIGGEGNGGVMLPELHIGRDAPLAAVMALQYLAEVQMTLSEVVEDLPSYVITKLKAPIDGIDAERVINHFKKEYSNENLNVIDGLKISASDWWVHLRKSNTEPIIRVIAEAKTEKKSQDLAEKFMKDIIELKN